MPSERFKRLPEEKQKKIDTEKQVMPVLKQLDRLWLNIRGQR